MAYRVIQWSTGNVGAFALRCILDHPELELAGLWVHGAAKDGRDAGELCGRPPAGVTATRDAERLLALDADCVCYTATADLRPFEAIEDICRILAAGKDVVSSSVVPLVHPKSFFPEVRDRLEEACRTGGTSFFTSGIDPGFANDVLPLTLSGLCQRWEIASSRSSTTRPRPPRAVLFETMGFGKPLDPRRCSSRPARSSSPGADRAAARGRPRPGRGRPRGVSGGRPCGRSASARTPSSRGRWRRFASRCRASSAVGPPSSSST
jgi:4-hydroxy-tetrahydrodipicolinate reductase